MATIRELTVQSGFVFEAEVEQLGVSSAHGFAATKESAVVRVTSILRSPPALANYVGQAVTVQLNPNGNIHAGDRAVFFTHGMHYGESLVVAEIGRAAVGDPTMSRQIQDAAAANRRDQLTQRLAQAELVISGVALESTTYVSDTPHPVSEHDPDWARSTIRVETVEKGSYSEPTKDILFARSMDIAWYRSPKVKEGDRGVWLLHRRDSRGKSVPDLAVVHPLDFQPATELENIRSLLRT
jgi:hypothetical protein